MRFFLIFCFLVSVVSAQAGDIDQPLGLSDFAYGMELSLDGPGAIYGLAVPAPVYQACTRADLGDLRVFGNQGVVPHLLRLPAVKKESTPPKDLPYFPLIGKSGMGQLPPDVHIETTGRGTIINIRQGQKKGEIRIITSYIIDSSMVQEKADWLELEWSGQPNNFSTSVRIETSDDLNNWQSLVRSASLAQLRFNGHELVRNRIALNRGMKKYLRLFWPPGKQGVQLTAVKAGYDTRERKEHRVQHLTAETEPSAKERKGEFLYASGGFFPVDQVNVKFSRPNSLARVTIFSRARQDEPWQRRTSMLAYQLSITGVDVDNPDRNFAATTDRFWRLVIENSRPGQPAPVLELGWLPWELVFIAEGEEPYTLAYGRAGLEPERFQVDRLLGSLDPQKKKDLIFPAHAGPQTVLGGKQLLAVAAHFPWRRWLLWAALVVGVLVTGAMALKLFHEMKQGAPD